ncbi:DsbA family protein [Nocardia sp. NPDC024068]|uniref:DsbA family protein n=1 Tax=Nocardia sp. NPDC024068 TaxID=3157197 RepID=UPI0033F6C232
MSTNPGGWPPPQHTGTNRRLLVILTPILVLVLAVAAIGIGLVVRTATAEEIPGLAIPAVDGASPANVTADGAVRVGDPDAKVTVRVVMDLQCPVCQAFEEFNGAVLADAVRDGTAAVEYSVISFLDRASTTEYSSRAGNASFCVANTGVQEYQAWLAEMFVRQPPEYSDGLPDSDLIGIAESTGYTDSAVAECITGRSYDTYLKAKTREVLAGGVSGTPTVYIDGAEVTDRGALMTQNGLAPLLDAAR